MSNLKGAADALKAAAALPGQPQAPHPMAGGPIGIVMPTMNNQTGQYVHPPNPIVDAAKINTEELATNIRTARMQKGLTQRDLAKISNTSQGSITRIENGLCTSLWMLLKVAAGLGMKVTMKAN